MSDESSKLIFVKFAINVLKQAQQDLYDDNYESAHVMVLVAKQVLEDLQTDFDCHFKTEKLLKQILK